MVQKSCTSWCAQKFWGFLLSQVVTSSRISGSPSTVSQSIIFVVPSFLGGPSWRNCLHLAGVKLTPFQASTQSLVLQVFTRKSLTMIGWFDFSQHMRSCHIHLRWCFYHPFQVPSFTWLPTSTQRKIRRSGRSHESYEAEFLQVSQVDSIKVTLVISKHLVTNQPFKRVTFSLTIPKIHTKNRQAHQNDPLKKLSLAFSKLVSC